MELESLADAVRDGNSAEDARTPTNMATNHSDISAFAFEEPVLSKALQEAALSAKKDDGEPLQEWNLRYIANFLEFEVGGRAFGDHFRDMYNQSMVRNCFTRRVIYKTLGLLNAMALDGNCFPTKV